MLGRITLRVGKRRASAEGFGSAIDAVFAAEEGGSPRMTRKAPFSN